MSIDVTQWGLKPGRVPAAVLASEEPITRFFAWHDSHPVALSMVLMEKFGHEWILWEAPTLKTEILKTFKATSVSEHNWNKIQAVRTLLSSISFWHQWEAFEKIVQSLNNNVPDFYIMQKCSVAQLMAGVDIASQIRSELFGEEVDKYVSSCALDEGITYLPPPLEFAQVSLSDPMYECKDCGNIDTDDLEDGRCDQCVGRYQHQHNLSGKPAPWVPEDVGKNIVRFVKRDPEQVKAQYETMKNQEHCFVDDKSPESVQACKLSVAYKYMQLRRSQLVHQLKELAKWVSH